MRACALILSALLIISPRVHAERPRSQKRLAIAGATMFALFYTLPLALAIRYEEAELAIPVLGPLVDLRRCRDCTASPAEKGVVAGLVLDAVAQAAGVTMAVLGLTLKSPRVRRVMVVPWIGPAAGISARASF